MTNKQADTASAENQGRTSVLSAAATSVLTLIVGGILWLQIGNVDSDLSAMRQEVATYRTGDAGRIDDVTKRLDGLVRDMSQTLTVVNYVHSDTTRIQDQLKGVGGDLNKNINQLDDIGSDVLVVFRLMMGGPANIPVNL